MGSNQTFRLGISKGVLQAQVPPLDMRLPTPQGRCIKLSKPPEDNFMPMPLVKS